jgi:(2Fe-2S) ferredoxin
MVLSEVLGNCPPLHGALGSSDVAMARIATLRRGFICFIICKRSDFMNNEEITDLSLDPPPFFDAHIFVCCNRRPDGHKRGSCAARGSEALRDYMKARVKEAGVPHARVNMAGCLDRCEDGPCVVIYPAGVWYKIETPADVDRIIEDHLLDGGRVEDLRLPAGRAP